MTDARRARVELALASVAYAAAVIVTSWPLALHAGDAVVGPTGPQVGAAWGRADLNLLIWILGWTAHALATQPLEIFQGNIFHPAPDTLAGSEHLLGLTPLSAPVFWLSDNAVLTYNVTILAVVWLSAVTTFALARAWSGSAVAGFLAGAAFAFSPQQVGGFARLHVSAVHLLPLVLLLAWRAARAPRATTLLLLWIVTALQLLSGMYVAYAVVVMVVVLAPTLVVEARRGGRSGVAPLATIAAALPVMLPVGLPYLRAKAATISPTIEQTIANVTLLSPFPLPLLVGLLAGVTLPVVALAVLGLVAPDRTRWHLRLGLLALALVGFLLSLGPRPPLVPGTSLPGAYEILMRLVPGFAAMRAPSRFSVLTMLAVVQLAALGAAWLVAAVRGRARDTAATRSADASVGSRPPRARRPLAVAASVAVLALALWLMWPRTAPLAMPLSPLSLDGPEFAADRWLRDHADGGAVIVLPMSASALDGLLVRGDTTYMVGSTLHFLPLVNGYSGHPPLSGHLLKTLAQRLPDASALDRLCELAGPRWIVLQLQLPLMRGAAERWQQAAATLGLEEAMRSKEAVVYRITRPCTRSANAAEALSVHGKTSLGGVPVTPLGPADLQGEIAVELPSQYYTGTYQRLWVDVRNTSDVRWPGVTVAGGVNVGSRWRNAATGEIVAADVPIPLGEDLAPGASVRVQLATFVPKPGEYVFEIGLGERGPGWFADRGGTGILRTPMRVVALPTPKEPRPTPAAR